jgi:hypothetical protein
MNKILSIALTMLLVLGIIVTVYVKSDVTRHGCCNNDEKVLAISHLPSGHTDVIEISSTSEKVESTYFHEEDKD